MIITKQKRVAFFLIFDILITLSAVYCAFLLRFSGELPEIFIKGMLFFSGILLIFRILFLIIFNIYRIPWRFFSLNEVRKILLSQILASICFFLFFSLFENYFAPFPRSVIIIEWIISTLLIGGLRIAKRMVLDFKSYKTGKPCVIIGSTSKTLQILKGFKSGYDEYYASGIVDARVELVGTYCGGVLVESKDKLKDYVKSGVTSAIIALKLEADELNLLYDELTALGFDDIFVFSLFGKGEISDISIEDLLARKPKDLDSDVVGEFIKDKIVLVTGAGGSIGSELCKLCLKFGAKSILAVDNSEFNLYNLNEELKDDKLLIFMENILNLTNFENLVSKFKPELIIHAAAYKHVHLCELSPHSCIENNIIGTKNVVDTAKKFGVKKLVLISTDKAVRPTNVMGASKRICELYTLNSNSKNCEMVAVRFGNVLGSSGSVIPKFKAQIKANKPLSLTHKDVIRYFMLPSEACQLVLQAASIAKGGELFVLDMGEPVRIYDLAKKMLKLSKKEHLGIELTGLRDGEKLYEELLIDNNNLKTKFQSIFVVNPVFYDLERLRTEIYELLDMEKKEDIIKYLQKIVPEFKHNKGS